jgi:NAD(P)H-dependent FMN reductase
MIRNIIGLYYSPIGGTRLMTEKMVRDLAGKLNGFSAEKISFDCYDLEDEGTADLKLNEEDIAVIATPVYMGKIPLPAARALGKLKGNNVLTLVSVSYGGRTYGNALFELQRYAEEAGFKVIAAGAFMVFCKTLLSERKFASPAIDISSLLEFEDAVSGKIKRLSGSEVEGLRIKPAPVEAPGHMPVHLVSKYSPTAAAVAQRLCEKLSLGRSQSEWFL